MFFFNLSLHMKLPRSNSQGESMDRCHVFKLPLPYWAFPPCHNFTFPFFSFKIKFKMHCNFNYRYMYLCNFIFIDTNVPSQLANFIMRILI